MEKEMCSLNCRYLGKNRGAPSAKDGFPEELKEPLPKTIETIYFCEIKSVIMGRSLTEARLLKRENDWPPSYFLTNPAITDIKGQYIPWGENPLELDNPQDRECLAPEQKRMVGH